MTYAELDHSPMTVHDYAVQINKYAIAYPASAYTENGALVLKVNGDTLTLKTDQARLITTLILRAHERGYVLAQKANEVNR